MLANKSPPDFVTVASAQKKRFESHRGIGTVNDMAVEYRKLQRSVAARVQNPGLRSMLEKAFSKHNGFVAAWAPLSDDCPMLRYFSGGTATQFQGGTTVENEYAIIEYEKDS